MSSPTVDPKPENPRACCILCATWVCHECWNWHRNKAARGMPQYCIKCGGIEGQFTAVRHSGKGQHSYRATWEPKPIPETLPKTRLEIDQLYFYG